MAVGRSHLQLVPGGRQPEQARPRDAGDVGLTALIFAVALFPLACDLAGVGRWGAGTLGLGTVGTLLAGRELWGRLVARLRGGGRR